MITNKLLRFYTCDSPHTVHIFPQGFPSRPNISPMRCPSHAYARPMRWLCAACTLPARLPCACHLANGHSHWNNPTSWDAGGPRLSAACEHIRGAGRAYAPPWSILTHFPKNFINLYGNELTRCGPGIFFFTVIKFKFGCGPGSAQARPTFSAVWQRH